MIRFIFKHLKDAYLADQISNLNLKKQTNTNEQDSNGVFHEGYLLSVEDEQLKSEIKNKLVLIGKKKNSSATCSIQ